MINAADLCMGCMKDIGDEKQCPYCGFHKDSPQLLPYLPQRTLVGGRYLIGKLLDYNGDGATYIGWDMHRNTCVSVREFLPDAIAERDPKTLQLKVMAGCDFTFRDCYQSFMELWRRLSRMRGLSALIVVRDIVEDYGTVYAVSEYIDGITLRDYLLSKPTGTLTWEQSRTLFMPVLSTLGTLHSAGIIHRGISPETLIVGRDGKLRISGFSIWQARTVHGDLTAQLFGGYAAVEQYGFEGQQGAWTDIYAFAAVLYRTLVGSTPIEATSRMTNDRLMVPGKVAEQIPAYVLNAMMNALQILPEDRTRTVEQLREELSASPNAAANNIYAAAAEQQNAEIAKTEPKRKTGKSKTAVTAAILSVIVCLGVFVGLWFTVLDRGNKFITDTTVMTTVPAEKKIVDVPDFKGLFAKEVTSNTAYMLQFKFELVTQPSDTVEEGYIISQSVKEFSKVPEGTTIKLTVSSGNENVYLPDVTGYAIEEATQVLEKAGFRCTIINTMNDGVHTPGTVAEMVTSPKEYYPKGKEIFLKVWGEVQTREPSETETILQ